jgi:two-component system capsular synthesis response regulator RcsB
MSLADRSPLIHIASIDDHPLAPLVLSRQLACEPSIVIAGQAAHSETFLWMLSTTEVDVVLVDLWLDIGDIEGIAFIRKLRQRHPRLGILAVSVDHTPATIQAALDAGADGFLAKMHEFSEIGRAIRKVAARQRYLHPVLQLALEQEQEQAQAGDDAAAQAKDGLPPRGKYPSHRRMIAWFRRLGTRADRDASAQARLPHWQGAGPLADRVAL